MKKQAMKVAAIALIIAALALSSFWHWPLNQIALTFGMGAISMALWMLAHVVK